MGYCLLWRGGGSVWPVWSQLRPRSWTYAVSSSSGGAEVPFGQSELRFFGVAVDVGNACCF
ncbi:MAG: hypothetical protein K5882_11525 [Bacteroidales bacterium]|nr:hypothetical protein [Bacteroidales bacterium]